MAELTGTDVAATAKVGSGRESGEPRQRAYLGWLLFVLSVAAVPIMRLALRRPGRLGGLLVECGVGILLVRAIAMVFSGAPRRLRLLPRLLLGLELAVDGVSVGTSLLAWAWRLVGTSGARAPSHESPATDRGMTASHSGVPPWGRPQLTRISRVAAGVSFAVHTIRMAIYLSPGTGLSATRAPRAR